MNLCFTEINLFLQACFPSSFKSAKSCLSKMKWLQAEPALSWLPNTKAAPNTADLAWPNLTQIFCLMQEHGQDHGPHCGQICCHLPSKGWMVEEVGGIGAMVAISFRWERGEPSLPPSARLGVEEECSWPLTFRMSHKKIANTFLSQYLRFIVYTVSLISLHCENPWCVMGAESFSVRL